MTATRKNPELVGRHIDAYGGSPGASDNESRAVVRQEALASFGGSPGFVEGEPWFQSDHMVFVQKGRSAMAITSERVSELMANYTHSLKDTPEIVDCGKLVEAAGAGRGFSFFMWRNHPLLGIALMLLMFVYRVTR